MKRYNVMSIPPNMGIEEPDGDWVRYEDYSELEHKLKCKDVEIKTLEELLKP